MDLVNHDNWGYQCMSLEIVLDYFNRLLLLVAFDTERVNCTFKLIQGMNESHAIAEICKLNINEV